MGYLDVRQAWRSVEEFFVDEIRLLNNLVLNDCLYRYMHTFRCIMILDPDEVIPPRGFSSLPEMIWNLNLDHPVIAEYHFRHAFFVTEKSFGAKSDITKTAYSHFLRYRYRAPFRRDRVYHMKSIFVAARCLQAFNHCCDLHFEANNKKSGEIFVDTNIAYLHHYRDQAQDESSKDFFSKGGTLKKPNLILDDSILAFEDQLLQKIEVRLELLNM